MVFVRHTESLDSAMGGIYIKHTYIAFKMRQREAGGPPPYMILAYLIVANSIFQYNLVSVLAIALLKIKKGH